MRNSTLSMYGHGIVMIALTLLLLGACGQKGELYREQPSRVAEQR
jgi:predicted small lipoprotein YifL